MADLDVSELITVAEAIRIIDAAEVRPATEQVELSEAQGRVLAEDVLADRDYPPFDKSLMDGFAVRSADVPAPGAELPLTGEIAAGDLPERELRPGHAIAIMTGAPLPPGADAVIPVEVAERLSPDRVRFDEPARPGRYIARRGDDVRAGATLLHKGDTLEAPQLAVAATVGKSTLAAYRRPRVAIVSTGNEIVPPDQTPGPGQIRNCNSLTLSALFWKMGCDVEDFGIVKDRPDAIAALLRSALAGADVLAVTGGMSMGEYDYVPAILQQLGFDLRIRKIRIKPGKPFVFGVLQGSGFGVQGSDDKAGGHPPPAPLGVDPRLRPLSPSPGTPGEGWGEGSALQAFEQKGRTSAQGAEPSGSTAGLPLNPEPRTLNPRFAFGLPGNPVSSFACTVRLASRLIDRLQGRPPRERWLQGRLPAPLPPNGPREFYQPAVLHPDGAAHVLQWKGSADVFTLARANALLVRPENDPALPAGATVRLLDLTS